MKIEARGEEKALRLVNAAPELLKEEAWCINHLFPSYLFRVRRSREIWTTCCGKHKVVPKGEETDREADVLDGRHTPEPHYRWGRIVNERPFPVPCPYCGKLGEVKELGSTGSRGNLSAYRRVVALRWCRGSLWARAYQCAKHYTGEGLTAAPGLALVGVYRFRPGRVEQAIRSYLWWGHCFSEFSYREQTGGPEKGKWNIITQFSWCQDSGMGYETIGLSVLDKTPLKYCRGREYIERHGESLKFLMVASLYPRQVEMLMKAGMQSVIYDLAERGIKNARAFNWEETDPLKSFGMTKQELREFMSTKRDIDVIKLYKQLRRMGETVTIAETQKITDGLCRCGKDWLALARKWSIPPMKLYRYFERQNKSVTQALSAWKDYINAAQALGYQLQRSDVLLPADLGAAHDKAAQAHRKLLQKEQERKRRIAAKEEAERLKKLEEAYEERRLELEKKYGITADGFTICVPANAQEIIDEGRILKHCVAGYAERHISGVCTILFMRKARTPNKPFLTIQMDGSRLVQIHGYKNEGVYTTKGRFAPDPRETYRSILDPWLEWIAKGSKRNKKGQPIMPKKKRGKVA